MLTRQGVVEKFSTFIQLEQDRFGRWTEDPRLKVNMEQQLKQGSPSLPSSPASEQHSPYPKSKSQKVCTHGSGTNEYVWTAYWHHHWQKQPRSIALNHLYAYLQEPCYWSAYSLANRFSTAQFGLSDCFQAALTRTDKVLGGFNPELGVTLSTYASSAFSNAIRDALSQNNEVEICSDWSLVRRVTRKRLREALLATGLDETSLKTHETAWLSFKTVCFPTSPQVRRLSQLNASDWEAIAQAYADHRQQQPTLPPGNATALKTWLENCAQYLRQHNTPPVLSLNTYLDDSEQSSSDFLERVSSESPPLKALIAQEEAQVRQLRQQAMANVLSQALTQLNDATQQVLVLYYRDRLKQREIAAQLGTKQYTISRQMSKARQQLLSALIQWSRSELHIPLDPPVLNTISTFLDDWLRLQFSGD